MKTSLRTILPFLFAVLVGFELKLQAQQLAFPGAEGFGRFTTGGRGGTVLEVTNLNDSGPGSFRAAVLASGARTIVFRVSGTIKLLTGLTIKNGNLTIAGQTAPGDGICISNQTVTIDADNIIIRYIRFRLGDEARVDNDAIWGRNRQNIIIDHCSMSWSVDEVGSFYLNRNFTLQWSILSESLFRSVHDKGDHGYGGIWGGDHATFHHNLLAHHTSRNPRFNGGGRSGISGGTYPTEHVDFRNNVIYNWGSNSVYGGENGLYNMVNNYYKPGPATPSSRSKRIVQVSFESDPTYGMGYGKFYINGNYVHNNPTVTADNWAGGVDYDSSLPSAQRPSVRLQNPIEYHMATDHTAQQAYEAVLEQVGAILPKRDAVDTRIVNEVRTGTATYGGAFGVGKGIIDTQATVGGWPVLNSLPAPVDTDRDGMPDAWETEKGFDANNAADRNLDADNDGYTNLEEYLNEMAASTVTASPEEEEAFKAAVYPNPFSGSTSFVFTTSKKAQVSLQVLDLTGKVVANLLDGAQLPGIHKVEWNGTATNGATLPAGLYLFSLQIDGTRMIRRVSMTRD